MRPEHLANNNNEVLFVKLTGDTAREIKVLSEQFHYSPSELVRLALSVVSKLLHGQARGNKFLVATPEGTLIQEWKLSESQSFIDRETQRIIKHAFPTSLDRSIADLDPDVQ